MNSDKLYTPESIEAVMTLLESNPTIVQDDEFMDTILDMLTVQPYDFTITQLRQIRNVANLYNMYTVEDEASLVLQEVYGLND